MFGERNFQQNPNETKSVWRRRRLNFIDCSVDVSLVRRLRTVCRGKRVLRKMSLTSSNDIKVLFKIEWSNHFKLPIRCGIMAFSIFFRRGKCSFSTKSDGDAGNLFVRVANIYRSNRLKLGIVLISPTISPNLQCSFFSPVLLLSMPLLLLLLQKLTQ